MCETSEDIWQRGSRSGRRGQQGHVCEETSRGRQESYRVVGDVEWKGRCEDTGRERQVRRGRSIGVVVKDVYTRGDACESSERRGQEGQGRGNEARQVRRGRSIGVVVKDGSGRESLCGTFETVRDI